MSCDLCFREFGPRRKGCCTSCARATLYDGRLRQVSTLLEREKRHSLVEAIVRPGNDGILASLPQDADWDTIANGIRANSLHRQRQDHEATSSRLDGMLEQAEVLKRQMIQYGDQMSAQRQLNAQRRLDLARRKEELAKYRAASIEPLDMMVRKTRHRVQRNHQKSADAKAHLCYTASWLAGVRQEIDQRRQTTGRIMLAGLVIPDLRELNGPPSNLGSSVSGKEAHDGELQHFQHINACMDNICRLIATWAHYLSISVPAEITLPHNDFPHSAILHEKSSYRGYALRYPGGTSSQGASPSASRILNETENLPRPRLLHLDRPLGKLAKEEPKAYGLFVEGIILLAWDLAWLCRTQGVTAINTFDEVCDIGRNIWLFHRAAEARALEYSLAQHGQSASPAKARVASPAAGAQFGSLTHGTVLHSLAGYEGASVMQNWRLVQPLRLIDKLRAFLLTEMTGAEWDVLSDKDFDDDQEDEVAVLVGGDRARRTRGSRPVTMSVMSIAPAEAMDTAQKHEKGWMKVRGRGNEA